MDKWIMFKNYMHNELGITKEDIRQFNEFKNFDVNRVVERVINDDKYFGSKNLKRDISQELSKQIMERLRLD